MSQNIWNGSFVLGNTSATTLSAGEGIKLDTSVPGVIGISNDETVLYSGAIGAFNNVLTLNEPFSAFQYVGVTLNVKSSPIFNLYLTETLDPNRIAFNANWGVNYMLNAYLKFTPVANSSGLKYTYVNNTVQLTTHNTTAFAIYQNDTTYVTSGMSIKFIGINRKEA